MGYFNIKLDDFYTEQFKKLKTRLKCQTNDNVVEKLIILAEHYFEQKLFKLPNQSTPTEKNEKVIKK